MAKFVKLVEEHVTCYSTYAESNRVKKGFVYEVEKEKIEVTEEEIELTRRARNLPIPVGRRNMQSEYRQATAFETLIGWWHTHDKQRLKHILEILNSKIET